MNKYINYVSNIITMILFIIYIVLYNNMNMNMNMNIINGFGNHEQLQLSYNNNIVNSINDKNDIGNMTYVSIINGKNMPNINIINGDDNTYYTIIMIDIDAPSPNNPIYSPYLHLILQNIQSNKITNNNILVKYAPITPPEGIHRYILSLYSQKNYINISSNRLIQINRANYDLNNFISKYQLTKISDIIFKSGLN
jgi:phosphatidylethanolamine-binding protein (PEBP) family uncharacterized protein